MNSIQVPTKFVATIAAGTHSNTIEISNTVTLQTPTIYSGEDNTGAAECRYQNNGGNTEWAQQFSRPTSGVISALSVIWNGRFDSSSVRLKVYGDSGGSPSSVVYTGSAIATPTGSGFTINQGGMSLSIAGGTLYWIAVEILSTSGGSGGDGSSNQMPGPRLSASSAFSGNRPLRKFGGVWQGFFGFTNPGSMNASYTFTQAAVAASGQWTSATKDSGSTAITTSLDISHTGTFAAGSSSTTYLEGSNDGSSWDVSYATASLNGTATIAVSARRYWRARLTLTTPDSRNVPVLGAPSIKFGTTATWISEAIDHTTDITALNSLDVVSNVPASTSVTTTIATSADNVSYSAFVAVGSATPARYSKVKVVMVATTDDVTTPTVSSVTLKWTVVSTLTSSAIGTGATPVGWELFTVVAGALGTITYQTRTATTSGGLGAAGYTTVTSGVYIPSAVNPWIQWKATFTATADNVPTLDSVVVNWFISQTQSIRVASIFDGLAYYLTAAEFGNTTNNIVFKFDADKNFRIYRGVNINCLSYFFNDIYYGSASEGRVVKWLTGLTDAGTNIALDVQTAAINYGDIEHTKILRKVYVTGKNTGATYTPQYSTDNGATWKSMVNPITGLSTYVTTSDSTQFKARFSPVFASDNATGAAHIFRLTNSDAFECSIQTIKLEAWIRQGEPR